MIKLPAMQIRTVLSLHPQTTCSPTTLSSTCSKHLGKHAVSGSDDKTVRVWDVESVELPTPVALTQTQIRDEWH